MSRLSDEIAERPDVLFKLQFPRISYLPMLAPRLHAFFRVDLLHPEASPADGWLSFEDVPLKWHLPAGLLYDLYSGTSGHSHDNNGRGHNHLPQEEGDQLARSTPWRLTAHYSDWPYEQLPKLDQAGLILRDAFTNSYKEASFVRHGSNRVVMSLGKDDATLLWNSVEKQDLQSFDHVNRKLLHPPGVSLKSIPLKVYLPSSAPNDSPSTPTQGHVKVVQSLVTPQLSSRQNQTLGTALNSLLPTLFPSRRSPLLAVPVLHGAIVPLGAGLLELSETSSYADGFIHLAVVMIS